MSMKAGRKTRRARRTAWHKTAKPIAAPECEVVMVAFEVDDEIVSVIDHEGDRIPIFPSERIGGLPASANSLREAIITVMEDLEPPDNGVC